jgi:hypothetical protein
MAAMNSGKFSVGPAATNALTNIGTFLLFLGDGRTGSTLTGSFIDAHANACISLEENILDLVAAGVTRDELYRRIIRNSARNKERTWTGYSYRVEGQQQGTSQNLKVIGDKQAGIYTTHLAQNKDLYRNLSSIVEVPVKAINSVRNSYDVIATRFRWQSRKRNLLEQGRVELLERIVEDHFAIYDAVEIFRMQSGCAMLDIKHESFIRDPSGTLRHICDFLGLEADDRYLSDCICIVNKEPHESRFEFAWHDRHIEEIARRMENYSYLANYHYED